MNVQRYELEIYHCNGGEMLVSETGDYVSHDDYAALEAKCAALAAENAGLKKYICDECYVENIKTGATKCAGHGMPETPATDAFLAEVRAQESAPLVRALTVIANSEQHDGETVVCDFDTLISVAAGALRDHYAAQLRKGASA